MRKLQLKIDELAVESFEPGDGKSSKGTVMAHVTEDVDCGTEYGSGRITCPLWVTCHGPDTCNLISTCYTKDGKDTCQRTCSYPC